MGVQDPYLVEQEMDGALLLRDADLKKKKEEEEKRKKALQGLQKAGILSKATHSATDVEPLPVATPNDVLVKAGTGPQMDNSQLNQTQPTVDAQATVDSLEGDQWSGDDWGGVISTALAALGDKKPKPQGQIITTNGRDSFNPGSYEAMMTGQMNRQMMAQPMAQPGILSMLGGRR